MPMADDTADWVTSRERTLSELRAWGERYERRGQRQLTRNVRYNPQEWDRVEALAAKAGWPPAKYIRLATLHVSSTLRQTDEKVERLCGLLRQLLDLVLLNPPIGAHRTSFPDTPLDALLRSLQELRDRLEHLHASFCFRHRDGKYQPPPVTMRSVEPMQKRERHAREDDILTRTEIRTVRFRRDEWERVRIRARRACLKPTSYVRAASLGTTILDHGAEHALNEFLALADTTLGMLENAPVLTAHLASCERVLMELRRFSA